MAKNRVVYERNEKAERACQIPPKTYIRVWWQKTATEEERKSAEERGATEDGAYKFLEDFVRKHGKGNNCLPDALAYSICRIFFTLGSDGDELITAEELKKQEEEEAKRAKEKAERDAKLAKAKADAERKEAERLASLTPEQRAEEERVKAEREAKRKADEAKRKEEDAKRKEREAALAEKRKREARQKEIRRQMEEQQLTFGF